MSRNKITYRSDDFLMYLQQWMVMFLLLFMVAKPLSIIFMDVSNSKLELIENLTEDISEDNKEDSFDDEKINSFFSFKIKTMDISLLSYACINNGSGSLHPDIHLPPPKL